MRAVREDPKVKGLLYAGTETGVYFSVDDGAHWQSLQLNLPTTPVHDLAVKDDDLVAATHGRAFWILDDVSPLRQASSAIAAEDFHLYRPATAIRLHFPDEVDRKRPVGDNPPKGAILYYYLKAKPADKEEITIEISDAQGKRVRKLSNLQENKQEQPPEWPDREKPANLLAGRGGHESLCLGLPLRSSGADSRARSTRANRREVRWYSRHLPGKAHRPGQVPNRAAGGNHRPALAESGHGRGMQKQIELARKVKQDIDALHRAVNQIRTLRANLQTLEKWAGEGKPNSEADPNSRPKLSARR